MDMSNDTGSKFGAGEDSAQWFAASASAEDPRQPRMLECLHERCFWFGKTFVDCLLAEDVFRHAKSMQTGTAMDAIKMRVRNDFPVKECFRKISDVSNIRVPYDLSVIEGDQYTVLMTAIGITVFNGDGETKKQLADVIYSCIPGSKPATDHYGALPPKRSSSPHDSVVGDEEPRKSPPTVINVNDDIPSHVFTEKLYEWEKSYRGMRLIWGTPTMVNQYQDWQYPLTVQTPGHGSKNFSAVAQQKQEAKHQVSKKACEYFEI